MYSALFYFILNFLSFNNQNHDQQKYFKFHTEPYSITGTGTLLLK